MPPAPGEVQIVALGRSRCWGWIAVKSLIHTPITILEKWLVPCKVVSMSIMLVDFIENRGETTIWES